MTNTNDTNEPTIQVVDNGDGTWTVVNGGLPSAKLTIVPTGYDSPAQLSIDVQPAVDAVCRAITFGGDVVDRDDRTMTMSHENNGSINPDARPFMCVDIQPRRRRSVKGWRKPR